MADYNGNDIYCDLIIPKLLNIDIIKETDNVMAFYHTKPYWPVHIVVAPKKHIASVLKLSINDYDLLEMVKEIAAKVTESEGKCRVLTNLGEYQDSKHLHFHISSGEPLR